MSQKIVINAKYGGFGLSMAAVKRIAELQGRPCYFFTTRGVLDGEYIPAEKPGPLGIFYAFDVPNPNEVLPRDGKDWAYKTLEQRQESNRLHRKHSIDEGSIKRDDPILVRVVEELGEKANGPHASLKVVEIPDGVEWEIDEYDGNECIREVHRSWS